MYPTVKQEEGKKDMVEAAAAAAAAGAEMYIKMLQAYQKTRVSYRCPLDLFSEINFGPRYGRMLELCSLRLQIS